MKDLYKTLNIEKSASQDDVKKSFRDLAKKFHPDKNKIPGSEEKFKEIAAAYAILSDPIKRKEYDSPKKDQQNSSSYYSNAYSDEKNDDFFDNYIYVPQSYYASNRKNENSFFNQPFFASFFDEDDLWLNGGVEDNFSNMDSIFCQFLDNFFDGFVSKRPTRPSHKNFFYPASFPNPFAASGERCFDIEMPCMYCGQQVNSFSLDQHELQCRSQNRHSSKGRSEKTTSRDKARTKTYSNVNTKPSNKTANSTYKEHSSARNNAHKPNEKMHKAWGYNNNNNKTNSNNTETKQNTNKYKENSDYLRPLKSTFAQTIPDVNGLNEFDDDKEYFEDYLKRYWSAKDLNGTSFDKPSVFEASNIWMDAKDPLEEEKINYDWLKSDDAKCDSIYDNIGQPHLSNEAQKTKRFLPTSRLGKENVKIASNVFMSGQAKATEKPRKSSYDGLTNQHLFGKSRNSEANIDRGRSNKKYNTQPI